MDRNEYDKLNDLEDEMWWFNGLHANLLGAFVRSGPLRTSEAILDAGCGTGGFLRKLALLHPSRPVIGLDRDEAACRYAMAKSAKPICNGSIDALPFADGRLAAIVSADVLCHKSVDERRALRDFHRCLQTGGLLVLNLPAYQWMMSGHDRAVHTRRRYTRRSLHDLLQEAGFVEINTTYWNTFLFPLMAANRLLRRRAEESDVRRFPRAIELMFRGVMRFEEWLLARGLTLPFGGSVLAMASRP